MRALVVAISALVMVGIASPVLAQHTVQAKMLEMKAKNPRSFDACQSLATSRGYRLTDGEYEARAVMMFIEGCIMGRQR